MEKFFVKPLVEVLKYGVDGEDSSDVTRPGSGDGGLPPTNNSNNAGGWNDEFVNDSFGKPPVE